MRNEDCHEEYFNIGVDKITMEMLNVPDHISEKKKKELWHLVNEFRDCFALTLSELGLTDKIEIDIIDNNQTVRSTPYKVSAADRETISKIVDELKNCGIATETTSPYASPALLVRKKNGDPRLVVDYRKLNHQTIPVNFPMPSLDENFKNLAGGKIFASLDLANGYMQVPLTETASKKTAFITPDTTGEFKRMVFGLSNAPFEFVRLMNVVLGPLRNKVCCCYLDDVIIPAKDWNELLTKLSLVFSALRNAKLTLNINKCEFGKTKIDFLGYIVSEEGLKPGARKVSAIRDFPEPRNVHEVRRFLGLSGFFRRFIPKYAIIAKPLTDLTKKNCKFNFD